MPVGSTILTNQRLIVSQSWGSWYHRFLNIALNFVAMEASRPETIYLLCVALFIKKGVMCLTFCD